MLEDVLAELDAAGRLVLPSVPAAGALLSGATNEAALWIAGAADRDRALREAWDSLRTLLRAVVRPGAGA